MFLAFDALSCFFCHFPRRPSSFSPLPPLDGAEKIVNRFARVRDEPGLAAAANPKRRLLFDCMQPTVQLLLRRLMKLLLKYVYVCFFSHSSAHTKERLFSARDSTSADNAAEHPQTLFAYDYSFRLCLETIF